MVATTQVVQLNLNRMLLFFSNFESPIIFLADRLRKSCCFRVTEGSQALTSPRRDQWPTLWSTSGKWSGRRKFRSSSWSQNFKNRIQSVDDRWFCGFCVTDKENSEFYYLDLLVFLTRRALRITVCGIYPEFVQWNKEFVLILFIRWKYEIVICKFSCSQTLNRFVYRKAKFLATFICHSCSVSLKVKCESYIPDSVSFYGDVKVTVKSTSDCGSYVMRKLFLEVRHCPSYHCRLSCVYKLCVAICLLVLFN